MLKRSPSAFLLFFLLSLIFLLNPGDATAARQSPGNVLILNSYHQGEDWSDNQITGIFSKFRKEHPFLTPIVESLDTKRFPLPSHLDSLKDFLFRKYRGRTIDLIMALDNPALDLLVRHPDSLFPGVPVVFAGINGYRPAMTAGRERVTGVIEQQDVAGTLDMALSLRPGVSKVLAVHDYTASGLAVRQEAETALAKFSGKIDITYSPDVPFSQLSEELKAMPRDGVVLILTYVTDKAGRTFTREESTRLITSLSPAPVYAMHETRLGFGIVGGLLLAGQEHGQQAATMALRILEGADPGQMPVEVSKSRSILDYTEMLRFDIPEDRWPKDAQVINRPISFWQRHGVILLPAGATIAVMGVLLSILMVVVSRLRRTQRALSGSESKYRLLVEQQTDMVVKVDTAGRFLYVSPSYCKVFGKREDELLGKTFMPLVHEEDRSATEAAMRNLFSPPHRAYMEQRALTAGGWRWLAWNGSAILGPDGQVEEIIGVGSDITERKLSEEALKRSKDLLSATELIGKVGGWSFDIDTMKQTWTDEVYRIHEVEISPDPSVERGINFYTAESRPIIEKAVQRAIEFGEEFDLNLEIITAKGNTRAVHTIGKADLKNRRIYGFFQDITERKRTEEEIGILAAIGRLISSTLKIDDVYEQFAAESQKLVFFDSIAINLFNIEENILIAAYVSGLDIDGRKQGDPLVLEGSLSEAVIRARAGLCIQPASIDEIAGQFPNLVPIFQAGLRSIMCVPLISRNEVIGVLHFRSKKPNAYTEQDLRLAERIGMQIAGAMANAQMFNDLSKAEKSLRESEERFRGVFESSPTGIAIVDVASQLFILANQSLLNIVGYTADELATKAVSDITHPEDWASEQQTIKEKLDGNRSDYLVEKRYVRKDGSIRWVEVKGGFLRSNPHQLLAIANVLDVTKRKQAEEEKRSLESRLQRAEKMEALGTLAGGVAHDLNNVLGIVVGYSEMLRDEIDESNPMRTDVTKIMEGGQRAAAIVQDLLTLARRGVQTKKVVNLNATIMDCQKTPEYEKAFSLNPNVQTKTGLEADLLNILGSPVHLVKTFINLVTNAVEAMPGGGMLTVSTSNKSLDKPIQGYDAVNEGDYVVLSITDTGEGISDRDIKHIFEPFYTKKVMGRSGTGLGLSVSRAHRVVRFSST